MHQTFYIDADEEISSVIDRLNRSMSSVNYFVVPKRAIFLLSIINLKLLKSEAEKFGKKIVIVTQDELGASMAERAGLEVKRTIDDVESKDQSLTTYQEDVIEEDIVLKESQEYSDELQDKKNRLKGVGTNDFYVEAGDFEKKIPVISSVDKKIETKRVKMNGIFDMRGKSKISSSGGISHSLHANKEQKNSGKSLFEGSMDQDKTRILEKMYSSVKTNQKNINNEKSHIVSGTSKKIFVSFISLCTVFLVFIAGYLFLPSAKVTIVQSALSEKVDVVVQGSSEIATDGQNNIKIRVIEKEKEISMSYDAQGSQGGPGKKAHGSIIIYNEYDSSPQTLVATTRFESADGKIFRLIKNVIVPGTTLIGGETKPGAIEAEIVADQAGEDFNLQPSSFKIPGFKGSPKYDKFSAKSTENFAGGSLEGGENSSSVSQQDIDSAKQKTEKAISEELKGLLAVELAEGEIILEQCEKISISKSSTRAKAGIVADKFDYVVSAKIKALVFAEDDIKKVLIREFEKRSDIKDIKFEISKLTYGLAVADFEKNTLELKIRGDFSVIQNIDTEKIKKELLGKNGDEIDEVFKNNKGIKNANVEFSMPFISQIPQYSSRVNIEIDKESLE
ncbi:MAG: hypothetical protein ACD_8C00122G0009 [uncultured bacterium]|nr:MAG: hypothetical protein ACD_8C00122G0009 [uncultured bacterium]